MKNFNTHADMHVQFDRVAKWDGLRWHIGTQQISISPMRGSCSAYGGSVAAVAHTSIEVDRWSGRTDSRCIPPNLVV